jgi:hypothetical protein
MTTLSRADDPEWAVASRSTDDPNITTGYKFSAREAIPLIIHRMPGPELIETSQNDQLIFIGQFNNWHERHVAEHAMVVGGRQSGKQQIHASV